MFVTDLLPGNPEAYGKICLISFTIFNMTKHGVLGFIIRRMTVEMPKSADATAKAGLHFKPS